MTTRLLTTTALLCLATASAHAQPPAPPDADALFAELDGDGDGYIGRDQWIADATQRAAEQFDRLDRDGNAQLTQAEIEAGRPVRGDHPPRR